jgi:hypothetical protein
MTAADQSDQSVETHLPRGRPHMADAVSVERYHFRCRELLVELSGFVAPRIRCAADRQFGPGLTPARLLWRA